MHRRISVVVAGAAVFGLIACNDSQTEPLRIIGPSRHAVNFVGHGGYVPSGDPSPRRSQSFASATPGGIAQMIRAGGNRALIGFKEANATDGVDSYGRVLTRSATTAGVRDLLRSLGVTLQYEFKNLPAVVAVIPPSIVPALLANPNIDYVEPVGIGRTTQLAQDTTWNIKRVQGLQVWPRTRGTGVKVLIMDTGIQLSHPDLSVPVAWRCIGPGSTSDVAGHGTHVAGIAAALNNTIDVIGLAHGITLMSANVTVADVYNLYIDYAQVACSIDVGIANGVFAYNMSFGGGSENTTLNDAINAAYYQYGSFFAASAGNGYSGPVLYPASRAEVVAVTAVDSNNVKADFANVGPKLELAAPGVNILSTAWPQGIVCTQGGETGYCSGTSMAAPHVTAGAALLKAYTPSWSNVDIRARLANSALALGDPTLYGHGLLQSYWALFQ